MNKPLSTHELINSLFTLQKTLEWSDSKISEATGIHKNTYRKWKGNPPHRLQDGTRSSVEAFIEEHRSLLDAKGSGVGIADMDFVQCAETFRQHLETMRDHGHLDKQSLKALLAVDDVIESIIPAA